MVGCSREGCARDAFCRENILKDVAVNSNRIFSGLYDPIRPSEAWKQLRGDIFRFVFLHLRSVQVDVVPWRNVRVHQVASSKFFLYRFCAVYKRVWAGLRIASMRFREYLLA